MVPQTQVQHDIMFLQVQKLPVDETDASTSILLSSKSW